MWGWTFYKPAHAAFHMNMWPFLNLIKSLWCPFHLHRYNLAIISSSGAWSWWTTQCPTCSSSLLSRHPKQQVIISINVVIVTYIKLVHNKLGSLRANSSFEDYFEKSYAGMEIFCRSLMRSFAARFARHSRRRDCSQAINEAEYDRLSECGSVHCDQHWRAIYVLW